MLLADRFGRTEYLDRPAVFYLDVDFQSVRRVGVLGVDGRRLRHRAEQTAVRLHRRRRDPRRHRRLERDRVASPSKCPRPIFYWFPQLLLEVAVFCVGRLSRSILGSLSSRPRPREESPIGGSILSGLSHALKSPYLVNVSLFLLLFAITSTFLYFQQAEIARKYFADRGARTAFFRQRRSVGEYSDPRRAVVCYRRELIKRIGVALTLALLPLLSIFGFGTLAWAPTIAALVAFQVIRRAGNFAFARPTPRSAVHRRAAGGQIQSQEFYRHGGLSLGRSGGRLVLRRLGRGSDWR